MVLQLAALIIIPIILTIVTVSPFDEPIEIEPTEPAPPQPESDVGTIFFVLLLIWFLLIIRILYKIRKGTFKIRTKF